ncbi:MAG: elongation factor G [Synergistaceae bacterium]|jgi:elongation factor G|nr:elongation factor G [Synergistaceae bacterium]
MGTRKPEDIRTVALVSHGGAGKTSLTEAMLFDSGAITRMGRVDDKNTVSDFDPEEQKRSISINSSLCTFSYKDKTIHLIDTPGFSDFYFEQRAPMRVVDAAIVAINATAGVEVQTRKAWDFSEEFQVATMFYISKVDKEHADFDSALGDVQANLSNKALPLMLPIGKEASFKGIVNVITGKAYTYKGDGTKDFTEGDAPDDMKDAVARARDELIERVVEADDDLMMRYLDGEELSNEEVEGALRKAVIARIVFPVIPGASVPNIGVVQIMDAIASYFPSPLDMPPRAALRGDSEEEIEIAPDINAPFMSLCFKVMVDPYVGRLSFIRVFSGHLSTDHTIFNVTKGVEERISSFRFMRGKEGAESKEVILGDIVAIPKLDSTAVGDTLSVKGQENRFPHIKLPKPVYSLAVFPKSRADEDKLGNAIRKILEEDKTLKFAKYADTGDSILSGMGDMHLDIALSRIKDRYKVDLETKVPKVAYRETIKKTAKAQGKYKKQTGGRGQYGDVHFELSPRERGNGITFEDKVVGGVVPKNFIPAAEKGLRESAQKGVLAGYPAVDFNCAIFDGSYHDVDSSEMAFKIAASMAFKKAFLAASPILIEPIMNIYVTVPEDSVGDVMGDLNSRRGRILGIDPAGKLQIVKAQCPQAELFRYAIILRSLTSGRGSFSMESSHYEEVPPDIAKKVIDAAEKVSDDEEQHA